MPKPKVLVLRTAGTNCDIETAFSFEISRAEADLVHINQLIQKERHLSDFQILAIPGGFTYGDDIAAGKILANELRYKLIEEVQRFIEAGKLIIGICNGFQVLVKAGLLPGNNNLKQEATLTVNDLAKFEDCWVYLKSPQSTADSPQTKCLWTKDLPDIIYLPVAHGEGKFVTKNKAVLERLRENNQIAFQYCDEKGNLLGYPYNPNGSQDNIAGICDETGRILGLMPHPERHVGTCQHPRWEKGRNHGLLIFKNGVDYARRYL